MATTEEYKNGGSASYQFSIEYIKPEDIKVKVDGTALTYTATNPPAQTTEYTVNGSNVIFKQASVSGSTNGGVRIYRRTELGNSDSVTFQPGSSIRAADLNANHKLVKFSAQEKNDQKVTEDDIIDGAVTSAKIRDNTIVNADINTSANIDNSKIADGLLKSGITVNSANIVDGSIVDADINASANIQGSKLANDSVALTKLGGGTLPSDITVTSTNIQNGTIVDEDIQTGTLDNRYYTETELNNGQLDNQYYTESELNAGQLDTRYYTETELDNGVLDPRYYTETELNSGQLNNLYYTETELDGGQLDNRYFTETESDARYFRQDSTETIASGDTWSASDGKIATTGAIDLRIIDLVDDVGGFTPIANETSFPTANPDVNNGTGTIVSVKAASTDLTPSSGTVQITNGAGTGNTVTITGVTSTIPSGYGFLVETTTTLHTYTFHRLVPKATEVSTIAANAVNIAAAGANVTDIHNFADLYQVSTSAPTQRADGGNLTAGDLWFDSSSNKVMMVYDGSAGDGYTATTPNSSDLAAIRIVSGQITYTEDLGLITEVLTTGTGNTTLNTVAGIASDATTVAGIASDVTAVAADATDIGVVAGKATEIGRLGTADAVADMNTLGTTATVSDMDTLADISSDITTVAGVSSNVTTVAGISSNVTAVAGNATNINAVAADATDIGAVAGKATEIGRLGTADAVADLAILGTTDVVSDLNTLATSAIVSDMDTLADISSNITSVANISSNVTTVAGNNAAVSTVANNDADISTVAGSIGNVNTTAGSISNVNTVAGSIANVNTAASNVTDINTFANRYRIDSSDPGSNNDQGDLYFNTTSNELRVYNGSTWQGGVTATGNLAGLGANTFTGNQTVNANIVVSGTVDGKDISALGITGTTLDNGVTATTQAQSDNSTKVSTTAYVRTAISDLVNSAPSTLDTLGEIATALNNDAALNTTLTNSIATKLPKTGGVMTGDIAFGDNNMIKMGASHDLQIYHGGSGNSYIDDAGTGALIARGNMFLFRDIANNHNVLKATAGAGVDLYHNNSRKFHTRSDGVNVIGDLDMTDADGYKINLGLGSDLEIFHDGSHSNLDNSTGYLKLRSNQFAVQNKAGNHTYISADTNEQGVKLFYDNNNKLETTSSGATITGTCTATTFSGSGASLTSLNASNISSGTISASRIPTLNQNTTGSSGSCTGNAATATNADTVDNLHASSFVRSDANDVLTGSYDFQHTGNYPVVIGDTSGMADAKMVLRGSSNPYIRFREGNTDKAYIQWSASGYLQFVNEESGEYLRIKSGHNGLTFTAEGTERTVWHSGNDGSGSGLDADLWDGNQFSSYLNQAVKTNSNPTFGVVHLDGSVNATGGGSWIGRNHAYDTTELMGYGSEFMIGAQSTSIHINYRSCNNGTSNHTPSTWYWRAGSSSSWSNHNFGAITANGTVTTRDVNIASGYTLIRNSHSSGHFEGGHNTIGSTSDKTSPIYTIGSSYNPTDSALSNMYGIGFSHGNASFAPSGAGWGMYVASDGDSRVFLDGSNGRVYIGAYNAGRYLSDAQADYGSIQINGGGRNGYEGFSIDGRAVFMHDGGSNTGIYNDVNNEWLFYAAHNGSSYMYNNGSSKIEATSGGASISGSLTATGNVTAYSDARLKTNVNTIDNALDIVDQLRGVSFDWKESGEHSIGVIAQEVEKVLPELVLDATSTDPETKEETTVKTVDYGKMVGVLINAIKELRAEVAELKGGK